MTEKSKKLYKVDLQTFNSYYVVAENTNKAYLKVRKYLDENDYGFKSQRELRSIELIADTDEFGSINKLFL